MKTKTFFASLLMLFLLSGILQGQTNNSCVTQAILGSYSAKSFVTAPVKDTQTAVILKCGIKAPSARNGQPWRFTVVKDPNLIKAIIPNATPGNVVIVISGKESQPSGAYVDFDCALATENMYIAAQSLGLGAHIYASPVNRINTSLKEKLSIPEGFRAISVLRIGNTEKNVDAVSSATTRKELEEVVNYK